jgi:hypothetical protein
VRRVLALVAVGLRNDVGTVQAFVRKRYFDVYNEYKHTFDVFTGMCRDDLGVVSSHIYVRVTNKRKGRKKQITYILDGSSHAVDYYESVFSATSNLINVLISNSLDFFIYHDGRYLIKVPKDYGMSDELKREYAEVIERYSLGWSKGHSLKLSLTFRGGALRRLTRPLAEDHIAAYERPLISRRKGTYSHLGLS